MAEGLGALAICIGMCMDANPSPFIPIPQP